MPGSAEDSSGNLWAESFARSFLLTAFSVTFVASVTTLGAPGQSDSTAAETVVVQGTAPSTGATAREAAIQEAKRAAIASRLESLAGSRDLKPFQSILDEAERYVRSSKVVSETSEDDSTRVELEVEVEHRRLRLDAGTLALNQRIDRPRVVVLISDSIAPEPERRLAQTGTAEGVILRGLERDRFETLAPEELRSRYAPEALTELLGGSPAAAALLARETLAELVVLGEAVTTTEPEREGSVISRNTATVRLRVIRAMDAKIIDELAEKAIVKSVVPQEGGRMAIEDASEKLLPELVAALAIGALSRPPENALLVTFEGFAGSEQFREIVDALRQLPGVGKVEEIYETDRVARVQIQYDGAIGAFVDELATRRFSKFTLAAKTVIGRDMTFAVIP